MAPLDHCSLSAPFLPPSPSPIIILLALCASPLPLVHIPRAERVLAAAAGEVSVGGRRRVARDSAASAQGREETAAVRTQASESKGTALCPPTGAPAPTAPPAPHQTERSTRTTARTSPSFTPLIPGLIAGGIGITLVPQRPWVPHVPSFREPPPSAAEPYFEEGAESNVTGRVGLDAYLDCKIEMQQELVVTWLHRKDGSIRLLTVGRQPYSRGSRFLLSHQYPNNWRLQISAVVRSDEGLYECQIATHPIKVRKVHFQVTAPELKIVDEDRNELLEGRFTTGSEVKLTCLATQLEEEDGRGEEGRAPEGGGEGSRGRGAAAVDRVPADPPPPPPPPTQPPLGGGAVGRVLWRRGGGSAITRSTAGKTLRHTASADGRNASVALIFHAIKPDDGGNYTCSLGMVSSAAVHIKVINGESNEGGEDSHSRNTAVPLAIIELYLLSHIIFPSLSILTCHIVNHLLTSS